jgi:3-oxoacyl-[acyl-carrier protein] reductase
MNILVTGGASGLGEAITKTLAQNAGDKIYFTYNKSAEKSAQTQKDFPNTTGISCNFEDEQSLDKLIKHLPELKINVLIHNAFTGFEKKHFHKLPPDYFLNNFKKNIVPVIRLTQEAITLFRKEKFGKIITILSSVVINKPPVGWSEYTAQKNYLLSLSKSWAVENAAFNITANTVSPSFMQTSLTRDTDERILEEMTQQHPLKKLLSLEEVAETVFFLTHCSQQINGTNSILNAASDIA